MAKIVLDTNALLSGFLFHGMIKVVLDLVLNNKLQLYASEELTTEVIKKLQEFEVSKQAQSEVLLFMRSKGAFVEPKAKITLCRDPKDNFVLELAETAEADYLITRDRDLLDLPQQRWKTTKIIKPEDFLPLLRKMKLVR